MGFEDLLRKADAADTGQFLREGVRVLAQFLREGVRELAQGLI